MNPITRLKEYFQHRQTERQIKRQANDLYKTAENNATEYKRVIPCLPFRRMVGFSQGRMVQSLMNVMYVTGIPDEVKALISARFEKEHGGPNMKEIRVEYADTYRQLQAQKYALALSQASKRQMQERLDSNKTFSSGDEANHFYGMLTRVKDRIAGQEKNIMEGLNRLVELRLAMRNCVVSDGSASTDVFLRYLPPDPHHFPINQTEHDAVWNTCSEKLNAPPELPKVRPIFAKTE